MSGVMPERREALMRSAAAWRESAGGLDLPEVRALAERTARNLEREAETGIETCVCCGKPFGQGALSLRAA